MFRHAFTSNRPTDRSQTTPTGGDDHGMPIRPQVGGLHLQKVRQDPGHAARLSAEQLYTVPLAYVLYIDDDGPHALETTPRYAPEAMISAFNG